MAETTLVIAGRHYPIRCRDGEETHLAHLATLIEDKARVAQQSTPGSTEVRTLLFAALFLADELEDLRRAVTGRQEQMKLDADDTSNAQVIEALAGRIEKLCDTLAASAGNA